MRLAATRRMSHQQAVVTVVMAQLNSSPDLDVLASCLAPS